MIIAIDGLATNGKTTLSKMISDELKFKNFSTGAIYRCITLEIINRNLDVQNMENALEKVKDISIDFIDGKVYLNNEDVTKKIREDEITYYSTAWGTDLKFKEFVRRIQKEFLRNNDTVIEGRDICTRVAPDADVKFYLYSDFEVRVQRLIRQNEKLNINDVREKLKAIDDLDINGENFVEPKNAIRIDTSNKSLEEVFELMMGNIRKKLNN